MSCIVKWWMFLFSLALVGIVLSSCDDKEAETNLHLSIKQLTHLGYYAYVLSANDEMSLRLDRDIYIYSLDKHCEQGPSALFSPIQTLYRNDEGTIEIAIDVSPKDTIVNHARKSTSAHVNSKWILDSSVNYYTLDSGGVILYFTDFMGMDVVISTLSRIAISEVLDFVSRLEYVGAEIKSGDPWLNSCK